MARKKKGSSSAGGSKGRPAVLSLGRAKKAGGYSKRTRPGRIAGTRAVRSRTRSSKGARVSYKGRGKY